MTYRTNTHSILLGLLIVGALLTTGACSESNQSESAQDVSNNDQTQTDDHEDEGHEDEAIIELSAVKMAAAKIETAPASFTDLPALLITTGQVDFNQDRLAHVSPRIPGRVHEASARLGQQVRRGEVLATLDSIELGKSKAQYLQAKAREELHRENYEREQNLYSDRISSEREVLEAKAALIEAEAEFQSAEETLHLYGLTDKEISSITYENPERSLFQIRAPLSGKVIEKHVTVGELVTPERNLFSLADLGEVWIWIDVYERDLQQVHVDDQVEVRVDAFPNMKFQGEVSYLSDRVDPDTRRVRARIDVSNADGGLRPGMFAQVELTDPHQRGGASARLPALSVPDDALQRDGDSMTAFVDLGDGRFERRLVRTGRRAGGLVEVVEGLAAGEVVVTTGAFFLKSEFAKDELGEGHGH